MTHHYLEVEAPVPQHFDFPWILAFLRARAVPNVEEVLHSEYRRSLRLKEQPASLSVKLVDRGGRGHCLFAQIEGDVNTDVAYRALVQMFDLDTVIEDFHSQVRSDRNLSEIVAHRPGIRLPVFADPFEGIVRTILGQHVSISASRTVTGRLVRSFGDLAPQLGGKTFYFFPHAHALAEASVAALRSIGLTRVKALAIQQAAKAVSDRKLDLTGLRGYLPSDTEATLRSLPGIGPWTTAHIRMRVVGDRDAFPATDLGVIKALARMDPNGARPGWQAAERMAEAWRPWRAYVTLHLWNLLRS